MGAIITIEGTIGVGKTTFGQQLADLLGLDFIGEPVGENPYLERYYQEPARWAFTMQCHLMTQRFDAIDRALCSERGAVIDRGLWGDKVFAWVNTFAGNMTSEEYELYRRLFDLQQKQRDIDLAADDQRTIYLTAPLKTTLSRIVTRGRDAEAGAPIEYLYRLRCRYEEVAAARGWDFVDWSEFGSVADAWATITADLSTSHS